MRWLRLTWEDDLKDDEIKTLQALAAKATPGPWVYRDLSSQGVYGTAWVHTSDVRALALCDGIRLLETHGFCLRMDDGENEANAAFIASAREAVPALCTEVLAARAEVERLSARIKELTGALKPFADMAKQIPYTYTDNLPLVMSYPQATVGDLRRARATLEGA